MEEMFRVFQLDLRFLRGKQKRSGFCEEPPMHKNQRFKRGAGCAWWPTKSSPVKLEDYSLSFSGCRYFHRCLCLMTVSSSTKNQVLVGLDFVLLGHPTKRVDLWRMSVSSGTKPFWWRCHPAQNDFGKMPSGTKPFWGRCHPAQNDFGKMSSGTKRYPVWSPNQSGKDLTLISRLLACQVIALGFKPHGREEAAVRWEETSWKIHKGRFNKAAINTGRFNKASPHEAVQWVVDFQLHWEPLLLELFEFLITTTKTYKTYINDLFQPTSLIDKQPIVAS